MPIRVISFIRAWIMLTERPLTSCLRPAVGARPSADNTEEVSLPLRAPPCRRLFNGSPYHCKRERCTEYLLTSLAWPYVVSSDCAGTGWSRSMCPCLKSGVIRYRSYWDPQGLAGRSQAAAGHLSRLRGMGLWRSPSFLPSTRCDSVDLHEMPVMICLGCNHAAYFLLASAYSAHAMFRKISCIACMKG